MKIPFTRSSGFVAIALAFAFCGQSAGFAAAPRVLTIGDSLTAEYDTIPDIPGFDKLPTDYAKVTVAGWEALSWVEVMSRAEKAYFDFGATRGLTQSWGIPRLSGYEYNWAIPGVTAGQCEDFVTSTVVQNFADYSLRQPLEQQLRSRAQRVVIWLGGNDFRANYGKLYDGGSSKSLVDGLIDDLTRVVDFVKQKNSKVQIVIANIPDLGACPSKKAAHSDPVKRARVTAATVAANARIAKLAASKRVALADVYSSTARLIASEPVYFGAMPIINQQNADNNPRYAFTRDGLHPNTGLQILNARLIVDAFNRTYAARIPQITDAQALTLLGFSAIQPFTDWLAASGSSDRAVVGDSDRDGAPALLEYFFGMNPRVADADAIPATIGGPVPGIAGNVSVRYWTDPTRARLGRIYVQYSLNGTQWFNLPARNVVTNKDGSFTAVVPPTSKPPILRLAAVTIAPAGSSATVSATMRFE